MIINYFQGSELSFNFFKPSKLLLTPKHVGMLINQTKCYQDNNNTRVSFQLFRLAIIIVYSCTFFSNYHTLISDNHFKKLVPNIFFSAERQYFFKQKRIFFPLTLFVAFWLGLLIPKCNDESSGQRSILNPSPKYSLYSDHLNRFLLHR